MAKFNKFPTSSGSSGGSASVIGGGPYAGLTGVQPSGLDSANFENISGYPTTDATIKSVNLDSYAAITGHQGLNSAGATVWTVDTTSLSTTTGATIADVSKPCWDGVSSSYYLLCAPSANSPIYTVSVDIATGTETLQGSFSPSNAEVINGYISSGIDIDSSGNIYFFVFSSTDSVAHIIDSSNGSSISEITIGDLPGNANAGIGGIYNKIYYGMNNTNFFIVNIETGSACQLKLSGSHTAFFAPIKNGQKWGDIYLSDLTDDAGGALKKPARWEVSKVSGYFKSLPKILGVDGGVL